MTSPEQEILVCGPEDGRWHLEMRTGNGAPERLDGEFDSPEMAIAAAQQVYPSIPVRVTDISGAPAPSAPAHEGSLTDYHYGGHSVTRDEKLTGRAHPSSDTSQPPPGPHPYQPTDLGNLPPGTPRHGMYGVASSPAEAEAADRRDQAARRPTGSRDAED
ncbi:hypothetical protein [Cupriavidus alkaliphilus]|uniref:DUF2188 domain-containing protein n=1 Tax=Cupriavidus alkaliphilus TaxID=942866 RepID=A0A7W4V7Y5_9BURK|nr:hypothetical protein [Cupriavidus alkaliphilus]MBB3006633.1 hypothetical protein [Cupriavidus alkaliphilus]